MERGDWTNGQPSTGPADQINAWKKQTVLAEHELPGTARHDPLAYLQNRTVDWLDHQLAARELLHLDVAQHAPRRRARVPEGAHPGSRAAEADPPGFDRVRPARSIEAAACMYALQHEVLAAQGIPVQGTGRGSRTGRERVPESAVVPRQRPRADHGRHRRCAAGEHRRAISSGSSSIRSTRRIRPR